MRRPGRKFTCKRCGRLIGEHGYSDSGMLSTHKCPHGTRCTFDISKPNRAKCEQCQTRSISDVERAQVAAEDALLYPREARP